MGEVKLYRDKNLQIVFGVTLMAVLGVSSITPAFPKIVRGLGISGEQVGLLITFFTMPGVVLAPFLGILADRFGRRRVLASSLFLFGSAGTACAFVRDFGLLCLLRMFQGVGGAALGSLNVTIIGDLYSGRRRVEAMGLNASVLSMGVTLYPLIGGALALLGWHYPFLLPILAFPIGILVLAFMESPEPRSVQPLGEYLGGTWTYLKRIEAVGIFCAGMLTFILLYGAYLTYLPLLLGDRFGASSLAIGIIMSTMSLATAVSSSQMGRINKYLSLGNLIKIAFGIYALALFMIPLVPRLELFLLPTVLLGMAHGTNMPSIQAIIARLAPLEHRAVFMTINGAMLRLGQTVGPPLLGLLYVYLGLDGAFFAAAILALTTPVIATLVGRGIKA